MNAALAILPTIYNYSSAMQQHKLRTMYAWEKQQDYPAVQNECGDRKIVEKGLNLDGIYEFDKGTCTSMSTLFVIL